MVFTFRGGVHPFGKKEQTENCALKNAPDVDVVFVPLSQHIGRPATPVVNTGDYVKKGQLIATAQEGLSVNVFSPVSGEVKGIVSRPTLFSDVTLHIEIANDKKEEEVRLPVLEQPTGTEIATRIKEAGVVGMGGAGFPTYAKLSGTIETLLINAAECEPYITCDYRILMEKTAEFLEGARLLQLSCGAKRVILCVENNKPEAIRKIASFPFVTSANRRKDAEKEGVVLFALKTKYPQGGEKQLIYAVTGKEVPDEKLPSFLGCMVSNAHTALAVYEAVKLGKPLYERYMTLAGECAKNPCNLLVKTGTRYCDLASFCQAEGAKMVVSGGPMMGFCAVSGEVSTTKTTGSLLFLKKEEISTDSPSNCIGCGKCASVCPMRLMPMMIDRYGLAGDLSEAERYGAPSCMECGCCSYVCPAKRPLLQSIRLTKKKIREAKKNG